MRAKKDRPTVVMVDDDRGFVDELRRWVEPSYWFVGLRDGDELLSDLAAWRPRLIVLDLTRQRAFEIFRKIRADERFAGLPMLFLTGGRKDEDTLRVLETGGAGYVNKPVGRRRLVSALDELIGASPEEIIADVTRRERAQSSRR